MTMCQYCHDNGMTFKEYKQFEENIKTIAKVIRQPLQYKGGMYFPTNEIITDYNSITGQFIIQELKKLDIEFFNNNSLYRVTR